MTSFSPGVCYPSLAQDVRIHRTEDGGSVLLPGGQQDVDGYFLRFLECVDGNTNMASIVDSFEVVFGSLFGGLLAHKALSLALTWGIVGIDSNPKPHSVNSVTWSGSANGYHPLHATLEIIETCNFTCEHCYYSSSPSKRGRLELEQALQLIELLANRGVRVLELTGGECTIHPNFLDILTAATSRFEIVAVISNGYLLGTRRELLQQVAAYENIIVQISIDGLEEHHDRWRRREGSFRAATTAVEGLVRLGVPVRVACSISDQNVDQVGSLLQLGKDLGVANIVFAPVAALGRGCNVTDPGLGAEKLATAIEEQLQPHAKDPILRTTAPTVPGAIAPPPTLNCGAGSRTYAIDYDGNVRACNFSRDSKKFGNLFENSYDAIFEQEANSLFHDAPSPGGADCEGCRYLHYCKGCFVKAFMVSEKEFPECAWRAKWFPGMPLDLQLNESPKNRQLLPLALNSPKPSFSTCKGCTSH